MERVLLGAHVTPSQLAVVQDALEEAGLTPAQVLRAVRAIDAEEVEAYVESINHSEEFYGYRSFMRVTLCIKNTERTPWLGQEVQLHLLGGVHGR